MRFHEQRKYTKATTWQASCGERDIGRWFSEHMPLSRERLSLPITSPRNYTDSGRVKPSGSTFINDFGQKTEIKLKKKGRERAFPLPFSNWNIFTVPKLTVFISKWT